MAVRLEVHAPVRGERFAYWVETYVDGIKEAPHLRASRSQVDVLLGELRRQWERAGHRVRVSEVEL